MQGRGCTYSTGVPSKGSRESTCTYTDNSGNGSIDIFRNGRYLGAFRPPMIMNRP